MVEIRYEENFEVADLAGLTVSEAREQFKAGFGIPDKARAKLNGSKVKESAELDTVLNDDDNLSFTVAKSKSAYLLGALLLALACTGGVFAYGFINASTTLSGASISDANFADVSVNSYISDIYWNGYGFFKGTLESNYASHSTNGTPIFDIDTDSSGYTGDLVVTVSLGNADELAEKYRVLALKLIMAYPDGSVMDINESGSADANTDWVMLTLNNGEVSMFPAGSDNVCTVRVKSGFFITHVKPHGVWGGAEDPDLFCEVAQR
jgi:hypothetical protein